jgi:uncharacterized protein
MILVDSGARYALSHPQDRHHGHAVAKFTRLTKGEFGRILTTDHILDEAYTLLRIRLGVEAVANLRDLFGASSSLQGVRVSDRDFDHAVDLMLAHGDKRWSLTDCTSFVVMRELEVGNAFTLDHSFSDAGFRVLPAE